MRRDRRGLALLALLFAGCGGGEEVDDVYRVPSESMTPTYKVGDVLPVDNNPESVSVGDVVIFHPPRGADLNTCGVEHPHNQSCPESTPDESEVLFMKRVVAKPGDRVKVIGGAVYIDGERLEEGYAQLSTTCDLCNLEKEITIPEGHLFVVGDNRGESADSRSWGPIRSEWVTGKVAGVNWRTDTGDQPESE